MACVKIFTNLPKDQIPTDFVDNIVPVLATALRKEEKLFTIAVSGDCMVTSDGDSTSPAAVATLEATGHVSPEDNQITTKAVSQFIHKELGIHPDRFVLSFYHINAHYIAKGGMTIAAKRATMNITR